MPGGFLRGQVTSIAQTPDGYLWLGTAFGLLRFDGVRVVPWSPPAGPQLPGKFVSNLLVARDGTLWIATWKGLASWKDGKLTQYPEVAGKIVIHPFKMVGGRFGLGFMVRAGFVLSEAQTCSATERVISEAQSAPCIWTVKATCGCPLRRECGGGHLVLQSTTRFPVALLRSSPSWKAIIINS
jgi:ligand-binding sensor domain-containing protein